MNGQPAFFEPIRQRAAQRWDQLEKDPELAGPWHLLFKQVQSPRHVLSELLQNADDAGATEASVCIEDQIFVFDHDGEDFTEEHFASLCRFAYSNKRALHTIGFRGVGFKSTFSLGDEVRLFTPSLCVGFDRRRFTEPKWLPTPEDTRGRTRIRVSIRDQHRQHEVENNLGEWVKSPVSLLFFKNIRRVRIGEREIRWVSLGPGPIPDCEWMALSEKRDDRFLLIRSGAEAFPAEALDEIRQERMLSTQEEVDFPPCAIEIVMGAKGRLYVVLPTGVETELPFACNAPFIQDPARLKIKDPEISPTNRWLLDRAGRLAATAMLTWLGQTELSLPERAAAYGLFPDVDRETTSLEGVCGKLVEESFSDSIDGSRLLLTEDGRLAPEEQSIIIPASIMDIWPLEQAAVLLDEDSRPPLCQHVEEAAREKLINWGVVEEITKQQLLEILQHKRLPRPASWRHLLNLWAYVAPETTGYRHYLYQVSAENLRIVPVQGKEDLFAANEVVRLGEKKLLQSDDDWEFLAKYLIVLNQNWPRFLAEQRRTVTELKQATDRVAVEKAYAVLEKIGMDGTSDVSKVINQVADEFFAQEDCDLTGSIQLAQIAAKLGASVGGAFRYVARDGRVRSPEMDVIFDEDGMLEELIPEADRDALLLDPRYSAEFKACSKEEWARWVTSGLSGLLTFIPLIQDDYPVYGRAKIEEAARIRGLHDDLWYPYVTNQFVVEDWDYEESYWDHWQALANADDRLWVRFTERLLAQRHSYWKRARTARILQVATTGTRKSMTSDELLPSWALRLRDLPCLPDTRGFPRKPEELLRRTPETESLLDVEPFVHGRLDGEAAREMLDLLGVRSLPTGPDRLLDCLRSLAKAGKPPIHEVEKWYRRLDQMVDVCSTSDLQKIKGAFRSEKLTLAHDDAWAPASGVFLSADDDVPGVAVIRPAVAELALWRKIGVAERPTADLAIEWLRGLPSGGTLSPEDARRVRAILGRHPERIWEECRHWLNLAGEWTPVESLSFVLTMQSLIPWRHLHQWVKQGTADCQRLPIEATSSPPFSDLPQLSSRIEERLQNDPVFIRHPVEKQWLTALGATLQWIELEAEDETQRVRLLAESLARTRWVEASRLDIIPCIDGTPAGTPRQTDVLWLKDHLYVGPISKGKLACRVPEEIGRAFSRADIKAALDYSFERSAEDIRDYLEENFNILPATVTQGDPEPPRDVERESRPRTLPKFTHREDPAAVAPPSEIEHDGESHVRTEPEPGDDLPDAAASGGPEEPAEYDGGDEIVEEHIAQREPLARPAPRPIKLSIMERFAKSHGFEKDSAGRFVHESGSWIGRTSGVGFAWELRSSRGDLMLYYWARDHCLEREPLQIEADIWALVEQHPDTYALVLADFRGDPVEVTGARLRAMRDEGSITLYPATYRLVYDDDHK